MNDGLSDKAEEIFFSALQMESPEQRQDLVQRECQGDAALRSLVEELLAAQSDANKFFNNDGLVRLPVDELTESLPRTPGLLENVSALAGEDEALGTSVGP
ncbi:MAG TPA: hypothetical protein VF988_03100, partial [Verrucomicrobiae bacterium]